MLLTLGISAGALGGLAFLNRSSAGGASSATAFECSSPAIVDGDTIRCGSQRVRLYGIDAPELPGHCRPGRDCTPGDPYASTANLKQIVGGSTLRCEKKDTDRYGRTVARCFAGEQDLSCGQIESGHAVRRYGVIWC
jgi:endonuclease YncB( thermonuclease family)